MAYLNDVFFPTIAKRIGNNLYFDIVLTLLKHLRRRLERIGGMHQLKKSYHRKSNSGFTLAETLVAIFVLSTVLAMSAGLLMKSYYASEQSRDLTSATLIARSQLERISETPFNELIGTEVPRNGKIEQGSKTYHWNLEVDDVEGEENLARLKIVVSWNARRGISQQEFSCLRRK